MFCDYIIFVPFTEREISHRLSDTGEQPNLRPRLTRTVENPTENVSEADKNITTTKKPLLNTSYSSEEILLQAASSLQGLEGTIFYSLLSNTFPYFGL